MLIYPSILEKNTDDLLKRLKALLPFFSYFQIDITDGKFVPNKTVQIEEIATTIERWNNGTIKQKTFEFHLMVDDYVSEIEKLNLITNVVKIKCVLIHIKVLPAVPYPLSSNFQWDSIKQFDTVQLMTVHPGQQGSPFVPEVLNKIEELHKLGFGGKIILDGAMNDKTLAFVMKQKYLPDAICPGSYFSSDIIHHLELLQRIIDNK